MTYEFPPAANASPGATNHCTQQSKLSTVCAPSRNHLVSPYSSFGSFTDWQRPGQREDSSALTHTGGSGSAVIACVSGVEESIDCACTCVDSGSRIWKNLRTRWTARLAFWSWWVPARPSLMSASSGVRGTTVNSEAWKIGQSEGMT